MAGIAAASSPRRQKVAKSLSRFGIGGTFMRSYSVGYLGAGFKGGRRAEDDIELLTKARRLGRKVADSILAAKSYPCRGLNAYAECLDDEADVRSLHKEQQGRRV